MLGIGKIVLRGQKPRSKAYPTDLLTIGDHIRTVRLDRGLSQSDVANIIGTTTDTITYWEKMRSHPQIRYRSKIHLFFGMSFKDTLVFMFRQNQFEITVALN